MVTCIADRNYQGKILMELPESVEQAKKTDMTTRRLAHVLSIAPELVSGELRNLQEEGIVESTRGYGGHICWYRLQPQS